VGAFFGVKFSLNFYSVRIRLGIQLRLYNTEQIHLIMKIGIVDGYAEMIFVQI